MTIFVSDFAASVMGALDVFDPERPDLGSYEFVPWVRNGLGAAIKGPPQGNRPVVTAAFELVGTPPDATPPLPEAAIAISRDLPLRGPGDVIGIDEAQIIRRFPTPSSLLDDDSSLAVVEFDRPDLPWLHSPHPVEGERRLTPWIALVVCDMRRATIRQGERGLPPILSTQRGELQPLDGGWAWAHAQVMGTVAGGPDLAKRLGDGHAAQNLSRLICPRRLSEHAHYVACVVPTFDCGVKAGLGSTAAGTLAPAWGPGDPAGIVELPVYASWSFTIGTGQDFEMLARRILPVPAPWQIGRRTIDVRTPRGGVADDMSGPGSVQRLDCALYSPQKPPAGPTPGDWPQPRTEELRRRVAPDLQDDDLPRVGARLYARFQRGRTTLAPVNAPVTIESDWFRALNLRPADRLVAALGTRVVQRDQDKLMQAAWAQVGAVRAANAEIDRIRLARYVAEALMTKTLGRLKLGPLMAITHPIHGKVPVPNSPNTLWSEITQSALPKAAAGLAFRRALAGGPIARAALKGVAMDRRRQLGEMVAGTAAIRDMRRVYADPVGIKGINAGLIDTMPGELIGRVLGVRAVDAVSEAKRRFAAPPSVATRLAQPRAQWRVGPGPLATGIGVPAERQLATLDAMMAHPRAATAAGREVLGARLAVFAEANPALAARTMPLMARLDGGARPVPTRGGTARGETPRTRSSDLLASIRAGRGQLSTPVRAVTNAQLADGLAKLTSGVRAMPRTPSLAAPKVTRELLLSALEPGRNARSYVRGRLGALPSWIPPTWFDDLQAAPVMAAPRFDRPMYEALRDYDQEWLIPNLGLIDRPDFATLLFDNPRFTEAFLVGLSDEMGRELLWRGYPTDQRGTYFYRFWGDRDDIDEIARFDRLAKLGGHVAGGGEPRVVILLRGQVVKRHPEAMFVAVRGQKGADGEMAFEAPPATGKGSIVFHALLADDTILVGFDLTEQDIKTGSWWFLLAEHPTAPRFGLDPSNDGKKPTGIDMLEWADMPMTGGRFLATTTGPVVAQDGAQLAWPTDAAVVARMLLQNPARAAFEAKKFMQGIK